MGRRSRASTEHFALHHIEVIAGPSDDTPAMALQPVLSTTSGTMSGQPVDDSSSEVLIGAVVPKRHARRAVTRTLLKRAIYAAAERHRHALPPGWWVVRLRGPFDRGLFVSAASAALRAASKREIDSLFAAVTGAGR
ncbi:MAG: ribonuclease P protein component [Pseudomonadota bacterium]|nr:ribonuclease P protein component [Pseudomonadota bacterium]